MFETCQTVCSIKERTRTLLTSNDQKIDYLKHHMYVYKRRNVWDTNFASWSQNCYMNTMDLIHPCGKDLPVSLNNNVPCVIRYNSTSTKIPRLFKTFRCSVHYKTFYNLVPNQTLNENAGVIRGRKKIYPNQESVNRRQNLFTGDTYSAADGNQQTSRWRPVLPINATASSGAGRKPWKK